MMETFKQEWKSYLDSALPNLMEYNEKRVEQKDKPQGSEDKPDAEIEGEDEKGYH